jgi:hypothetical protein
MGHDLRRRHAHAPRSKPSENSNGLIRGQSLDFGASNDGSLECEITSETPRLGRVLINYFGGSGEERCLRARCAAVGRYYERSFFDEPPRSRLLRGRVDKHHLVRDEGGRRFKSCHSDQLSRAHQRSLIPIAEPVENLVRLPCSTMSSLKVEAMGCCEIPIRRGRMISTNGSG